MVGGPCSYKTTFHAAKVLELLSNADSSQIDAVFEVEMQGTTDTFTFQELNNRFLTLADLDSTGLAVGAVFSLAEDEITSGTCTPHILHFKLVPFTKE